MSSSPDEFLDTNILVYAFSTDPRGGVAESLLAKGCAVGLQGLNEFTNVARRKLGMDWAEVRASLDAIRALCPVILSLDEDTHSEGLAVAERYGLAFFDALMIAAALRAECRIVWSEDMQDGLLVGGRLRIANPFKTG
jgi:predicted nucleic acid-binding protein